MSERMRAFDWTDHPLGPPEDWPTALRSALGIALNSAFPTCIYWGSDLRLLYNDAWSTIPGPRHPDCLGEPAAQVWSDIWHIIEPQFTEVISSGQGLFLENQMLPMRRFGVEEETYWTYNFTPIRTDDGSIGGIYNSGSETTPQLVRQRNTSFLLELSDVFRNLGDPALIRPKTLAMLGEHLGADRVGLRERAAAGPATQLDITEQWNAPGIDPVTPRPGAATLDHTAWAKLLDGHVIRLDGTDADRLAVEKQVLASIGCEAALAVPWAEDGQTTAVIFVHSMTPRHWTDEEVEMVEAVLERTMHLVARARAVERERVMSNEINHRARNLLSVAQAIVRLARPEDPKVMRDKLVSRIGALSKSHSLLADLKWEPVALRTLLDQELAPYVSGGDGTAKLTGPDVVLSSSQCQALGLVLHELVTNAAKYGALADSSGRLAVGWDITDRNTLRIDWCETCREPIQTTDKVDGGFGSRLLTLMIERQLEGSFERNLRPNGLHFVLEIPWSGVHPPVLETQD
ncbi:MAG: HWE histidine kinase domain-containing protein [Pseudomonadota bacterium]|nr:HWE histidine kinase domain-containing protein [Pseudomonadota bacterium]